MRKILFMVGPSGGHLIPALRFALYLREKNPVWESVFVGCLSFPLREMVEKNKFPFYPLRLYPPHRSKLKFLLSFLRSSPVFLGILLKEKPRLIFSSGGYPSLVGGILGRILRIPLLIYEPNLIPGRANLFLSRFSSHILLGFPETSCFFKKARRIGIPVGEDIDFQEKKFLLVMGGSQGADFFNTRFPQLLIQQPFPVVHLTGKKNVDKLKDIYGEKAEVIPYHFPLDDILSRVSLCISRGGAITLKELQARGISALIFPLITRSTDHQRDNAYYFHHRFGFHVGRAENWDEEIKNFLLSPPRVKKDHVNPLAEEEFWRYLRKFS